MAIKEQICNVYKSSFNGRRYLTKNSAVRAEAIGIILKKYPTESPQYAESYGMIDGGWHWTELPNSKKMLRRLMRKIRKSISKTNDNKQG
jgi:hypothetical protein